MSSVTSVSPAAQQASAAVVNIEATAKTAHNKRDDHVAAIDTSSGGSAKSHLSAHNDSGKSSSHKLDIRA
jgi:hypothetical protein